MKNAEQLKKLFEDWAWEKTESIEKLPPTASNRKYYRLKSKNKSAIGVVNFDRRENFAFVNLTNHFLKKDLPVPQFYADDLENQIYLIKDLGDTTLYSFMSEVRKGTNFPDEVKSLYKE